MEKINNDYPNEEVEEELSKLRRENRSLKEKQ